MKRLFDPVTLTLFVAVCEEGNIGRAAEREAIVPSAISKRIAALEDELGVTVLVRFGAQTRLNAQRAPGEKRRSGPHHPSPGA